MSRRLYITLLCILLAAGAAGFVGCGGETPSAVNADQDPPGLDGERINSFYTNQEIAYLLEIGLWNDTSLQEPIIRRWLTDIRIGTKGSPTQEDLATIRSVADELDGLAREVSITVDSEEPNVILYFVPRGAFGFIRPDYTYPDFGYTSLPNDALIYRADILVATDSTSQSERNALIHRGLAAGLGLANYSSTYPQSMFHATSRTVPKPEFAPIDRTIIELLYSSELWPGMKRNDIIRTLTNR